MNDLRSTSLRKARPVRRSLGSQGEVPPEPPASAAFTFAGEYRGKPIGFDPCTPIRYRVGGPITPSNAVRLVQNALAEVTSISGQRFTYLGTTDHIPRDADDPGPGVDAWIGWASSRETNLWSENDFADGYGGNAGFNGRAITGFAMLKSDSPSLRDPALLRGTLRHEIGHLLGLGHVDDIGEVMYRASVVPDFAAGDRMGLWRLGTQRGCLGAAS